MSKRDNSATRPLATNSPVRTRRSFGRKIKEETVDSRDNAVKEPSNKRRRQNEEKDHDRSSRPRTRSLTLEIEVPLPRGTAREEVQEKLSRSLGSREKVSQKKRPKESPKGERAGSGPAVRRSVRESRKVFESLNEHSLVHSLVGDYLENRSSSRKVKRRQLLDEGETDSQEERPGYVSMYDMIKSKSKTSKDDEDEEEEEGEDNEENEDGDEDDNSSDENEEEDDDVTPQQRYKLRENKPVTKRYTAPPLKAYHSSRRGLFSSSRAHMRERACADKQPFSPVRKTYKLKRKTINESSTSTDESDDDDNRKFERRKAKSMAKARNRCLPMNLGLEDMGKGILADRERIGSSLADVDPMNVDRTISFESIGGLSKHVRSLKEMVVFPLLYPEIFEKFKVNPPRGVLFHGPPGTGKTLMARALANECSQDDKKVAFFMRKGADCLSKWVGESERQLRLLFDQAFKMRPSIIFFDEIDGLAPVRSSRQDQIHSSIVSTLLALMDGLDNRGEIVVIGATNRIDSIDPALRRPGRFDREFIFPLPDKNARRSILSIHTKAWQPRLTQGFINEVADNCVGYCGADIKALCTEATLFALRRRYPQIYASKKKLVLDVDNVRINSRDFTKAMKTIVPACQRAVISPGRALSNTIRPLLHDILTTSLAMIKKIFPPSVAKTVGESSPGSSMNNLALSDSESSDDGTDDADIYEMDPTSSEGARVARAARAARRAGLKSLPSETGNHCHSFAENPMTSKLVYRPRYMVCGRHGMGQSTHLTPAILHSMEHLPVHCLDLPALFGCASKTPEEACAQVFREARRVAPSVIYLPRIDSLWKTTTDTLKATFMSLVNDLPPTMPLLLFATSDFPSTQLPYDLNHLFSTEADQVFEVPYPTAKERWAFFEPLLVNEALKIPCSSKKPKTKKPLEVLPVAPPPEPRKLNASELQKVREDEDNTLRELRIFLREITVKLMSDRKFKEFYKPVDLEEVPDYLDVIKNPMDLSTMLQKVDGHQYQTCAEYLEDIDMITSNALEYNPNQDTFDRLIRHRACALKDCAHSLIKSQLDLDFEKACREIAESRKTRGDSRNVCAPKFLPVAQTQSSSQSQSAPPVAPIDNTQEASGSSELGTRMSRRVRGLDADADIALEYPSIKSNLRVRKAPAAPVNPETQAPKVKKSSQRYVRGSQRRRRRRRKPSARFSTGTPLKSIPEPEHSGPDIEHEISGNQQDAKDANSTGNRSDINHIEDTEVIEVIEDDQGSSEEEGDGNEEDNMSMDEKNETAENSKNEEKRHNGEDSARFENKSPTENTSASLKTALPDSCTNNYINSLHMRSEVKSALKSRLDSLNYNHEGFHKHSSHHNEKERECPSETNLSMATSEISNCDSKDVAELDSMLSASPLPVNGISLLEDGSTVQNLLERTEAEGINGDHLGKRWTGIEKGESSSAEKSKRVLFAEDNEVRDVSTPEKSGTAVEATVSEPSKEDRAKFEELLMELVHGTKDTTIETLELYYSRIRQCVLQHRKDSSRQPLLKDLKTLLDKHITSSSIF